MTAFETALIPYVQTNAPDIFEAIKKDNQIKPETDKRIKQVLGDFAKSFA